MKEQSESLKKIIADEEQHKKERKAAGNLFTGYDKVSPKQKRALLEKLAGHIDNWDDKLVYEDLLRTVEKSKLGLTLNYQYVDENLNKSDAVFVENKDLSLKVKDDQPNNLIIEGDNLHTLTALKNTNQEVDVIYIDPPYNTGREFAYNDKLVSGDDQQKHSKWLSFMSQRLELAKELLSDDGIIFISIDDNEHAYLKVLMDETFGTGNYICDFVRKTRSAMSVSKIGVNLNMEFTVSYAKNKNNIKLRGVKKDFKNYKNPDNDKRGSWMSDNPTKPFGNKSNIYDITNPITQEVISPPKNRYWVWTEERFWELYREGRILFSKKIKENKRGFLFKRYKNEIQDKDNLVNSIDFIDNKYLNQVGTKEAMALDFDFEAPKPTIFIKDLLRMIPNKNATVLDFFAGSGTTGQAVMELNQEDGGNRRFILCTNNERTGYDTIKNPETGIAQAICRERIYRVINGVGSKGEPIKWTYSDDLKSLKDNSVRYLKTELVNKRRYEKDKPHLTHNLFYTQEQIDLYKKEFDSDSTEAVTDFKKRKRGISR